VPENLERGYTACWIRDGSGPISPVRWCSLKVLGLFMISVFGSGSDEVGASGRLWFHYRWVPAADGSRDLDVFHYRWVPAADGSRHRFLFMVHFHRLSVVECVMGVTPGVLQPAFHSHFARNP